MPGCVGQCTYIWDAEAEAWYPGGFNTCESGCTCGPAPGQEGPYNGYVATVACEGTPASTTTTSSSSSSTTTSSTTTSSTSTAPPTTTTSSSSSSSTTSSTTTSSTTSSTTTSTTTTSAPCDGICTYSWLPVGAGYQWVLQFSTCTAPGCYCNPPGYSGSYHGQEGFGFCLDTPPTTTTTTSTTTSTTTTAPPTTTTTTSTGTTTSSTTTTTTTEQPCTGTCTWRWYADLQKWIKVSGGNGTCSTGCSCSYPESNGTTDGETATPACKRLTCKKCCNNEDCCPVTQIPVSCCDPAYKTTIPSVLYMTIIDLDNKCPCIDGKVIRLGNADNDNVYIQAFWQNVWIAKNVPDFIGYKELDFCTSGMSITSGGPFNYCTNNKLRIYKVAGAGQTGGYYGPAFYCHDDGTFRLSFHFLSKLYLSNTLNCGTWGDPGGDLAVFVAGISNNKSCASPFYYEFLFENYYNLYFSGSSNRSQVWTNLFNCSGSGNFKVTITE